MEKFDIGTATKAECLAKADRLLDLGIKAAAAAKSLDGKEKEVKMRQVEFALASAYKTELAAFDGRQ